MKRLMMLTLAVCFVTLTGCGQKTTEVKGKVTYKNEPLQVGTVIFVGEDGRQELASLSREGTFTIPRSPRGKVRVAVQTPAAGMPGVAPPKTGSDKRETSLPSNYVHPVPIPARYGDVKTSGLEYEITGPKTLEIALTP
jgi:hypothetical protein